MLAGRAVWQAGMRFARASRENRDPAIYVASHLGARCRRVPPAGPDIRLVGKDGHVHGLPPIPQWLKVLA